MSVPAASAAATIALAGSASGTVALIVLHLLPTGVSPVADAVSRYGISSYRWGYRAQTLGYAAAAAALAVGLVLAVHRSELVVALCVVFATARALISWFPMDEPGRERTRTGRQHGLLAAIAFVSIADGAARLPIVLHRDSRDAGTAAASAVLGWLMFATLMLMVLARRADVLASRFGLVERAFYLLTTVWLVLVATLLE